MPDVSSENGQQVSATALEPKSKGRSSTKNKSKMESVAQALIELAPALLHRQDRAGGEIVLSITSDKQSATALQSELTAGMCAF